MPSTVQLAACSLQDPQRGTRYACPPGDRLWVGRPDPRHPDGPQPDVPCTDDHVSRRHCELLPDAGGLRVFDMSRYGTYVNGARVQREGFARPGDRIVLGHRYELRVLAAGSPEAAAEAEDLPRIGERYQVVRELGEGGMGVVYEALDVIRQTRCAVKVLRMAGTIPAKMMERFRREAELGRQLGRHPHIVGVYDLGTMLDTGELYCAMDYVDGEPFTQRIKARRPRAELLRQVVDIARAVHYAHEQGVVHRDLKPENVLVTRAGEVRLMDFGIAKVLDDAAAMTAPGARLGTPHYMAPEQTTDSSQATPAADVYALGGILFSALTGRLPFPSKQIRQIIQWKREGRVRPPSSCDPSVSSALDAIVLRALQVDPGARQASAAALADALEACLPAEAARPQPTEPPPAPAPAATWAAETGILEPGGVVAGRFRLTRLLGRGGAGAVYAAEELAGGETIALKLVQPAGDDPAARQRFLREVAAGQAFRHPHAVGVRDSGETADGLLFLIMELAPGEGLDRRLARLGRLPPEEVRRIGIQALGALEAAHARGLVHRDLKPANLLVEETPVGVHARILDFGIAKASGEAGILGADLTVAGATVGTVRYMSPEQACGDALDGRSDLYALATVLYELLTGTHPLGELRGPPSTLMRRVATATPHPLRELLPELPLPFAGAIATNLAKRPDQRHPDAASFRLALEASAAARLSETQLERTCSEQETLCEEAGLDDPAPTYSALRTLGEEAAAEIPHERTSSRRLITFSDEAFAASHGAPTGRFLPGPSGAEPEAASLTFSDDFTLAEEEPAAPLPPLAPAPALLSTPTVDTQPPAGARESLEGPAPPAPSPAPPLSSAPPAQAPPAPAPPGPPSESPPWGELDPQTLAAFGLLAFAMALTTITVQIAGLLLALR